MRGVFLGGGGVSVGFVVVATTSKYKYLEISVQLRIDIQKNGDMV